MSILPITYIEEMYIFEDIHIEGMYVFWFAYIEEMHFRRYNKLIRWR